MSTKPVSSQLKLTILIAVALLAAACTKPPSETHGSPVIFIHGIKGSSLIDRDGNHQWLTPFEALGLRTPLLALPLDGGPDQLHPGEPLGRIRIIPGILGDAIYGPWLAAGREMGHPFYAFAYDWRRDNLESLEAFNAFVADIRKKHGGSRVEVVAHSMGGLITLAALNQNPGDFERIVFAGVPFPGGVGFLRDLHQGEPTGLNHAILSPEVMFTFPSVYTLFPLDGRGLADSNGKSISMDFYSARQWESEKLGVFAPGRSGTEAQLEYLGRILPRAKKFRQLLGSRPAQDYPPLLVVSGNSRPTLNVVVKDGPKSVFGWDFESGAQVPGDGRIPEADSMPPPGIPFKIVHSDQGHSDLLNDPNVQQQIRIFLGR